MISLADAKLYLRIDADDDDAIVTRLIASASSHLTSIGVDMEAAPIPEAVEQAQYLLIGHFYECREATGPTTSAAIDFGVDRLIAPYREQGI